jgi:Kef-type K+ transport system membrane component KefB
MAGWYRSAVTTGHVAIFMPGVRAGVTAAFVGVTLAITAFPMPARIIVERGLPGTRFGSLALACGGIDDMAAWILLAGVLSLASTKLWPFAKAAGGAVVFAAILVLVIRPLLDRYLPRPWLSAQTVLLVPMFFTYSGLNTRFALLTNPRVLLFSVAAIAVAVLSKGGACWPGARLAGERDLVPARAGTLMNARGLMQLIALPGVVLAVRRHRGDPAAARARRGAVVPRGIPGAARHRDDHECAAPVPDAGFAAAQRF